MVSYKTFTVPLLTSTSTVHDTQSGAFSDLLNQNVVTTAGLAVGGTTAVVGLGVATAAVVVLKSSDLFGTLLSSPQKQLTSSEFYGSIPVVRKIM